MVKGKLKRIVMILCVFGLTVGLCQPVYAARKVGPIETRLSINDKMVLEVGYLYEENTIIYGDKGTATFDYDSKTLTLNNFEACFEGYACIRAANIDNFTIKIVGTNKLTNTGSAIEYSGDGPIKIEGENNAKLIMECGSSSQAGDGIYVRNDSGLYISNLELDIKSNWSGIDAYNIFVDNCTININNRTEERYKDISYHIGDDGVAAFACNSATIKNSYIRIEDGMYAAVRTEYSEELESKIDGISLQSDAKMTDFQEHDLSKIRVKSGYSKPYYYTWYAYDPQSEYYSYYKKSTPSKQVIIRNYHNLTKHDAVASTCTNTGNIEYYTCNNSGCENCYYSDAEGLNRLSANELNTPINPDNHISEKEETKKINGKNYKVTKCTSCGVVISRTEISSASGKNETGGDGTSTNSAKNEKSKSVSESYGKLQAQATKTSKNSVTLKWNKIKNADGYLVYASKCGNKNGYKLVKTLTNNSDTTFTHKKLKKGTYYNYQIVAYKNAASKKTKIAKSKPIYVTTAGGKNGNIKNVSVKKNKVTIKKGKTTTISASYSKNKKTVKIYRKLCFETSNSKIAKVTSKGVIKGIKKGKCTVYVYAQNGICKKVEVTVK